MSSTWKTVTSEDLRVKIDGAQSRTITNQMQTIENLGEIIRELRAERKSMLDAIEVLEHTKYEGLGHAIKAEMARGGV